MAQSFYPRNGIGRFLLVACLLGLGDPGQGAAAEEERWASLKADRAHLRLAPGFDRRILWTYQVRGWPIRIVDRYDHWYQVATIEGEKGWIHRSLVSGRRTALVVRESTLRKHPRPDAAPRARVEAGALVGVLDCHPVWCEVQAGKHEGFLEIHDLRGGTTEFAESPAKR